MTPRASRSSYSKKNASLGFWAKLAIPRGLKPMRARARCAKLSGLSRWQGYGFVILSLGLNGCKTESNTIVKGDAPPIAQAEQEPKPKQPSPVLNPANPSSLSSHERATSSLLRYREFAPPQLPADAPLVFAAHGRGDRLEGFERFASALQLPMRVIVMEGPLPFGERGFQWFQGREQPGYLQLQTRLDDIAELKAHLHRIYPQVTCFGFFGFSQGGALAGHLALERPELFHAVASLSGFLLSETLQPVSPHPSVSFFASVGSRDHVIRPEMSWAMVAKAEATGRQVERFTFEGAHEVRPELVRTLREFFTRKLTGECVALTK